MAYGKLMVGALSKMGAIVPQSEYIKTKALPPSGGKPKKDAQTPKRAEAKAKRKGGERTPMDTRLV